jgi:hypothetical protein
MGYQIKITKDEALIIAYSLHIYWYQRNDSHLFTKKAKDLKFIEALRDLEERIYNFSDDKRTTYRDLDEARKKALVRIAKKFKKKPGQDLTESDLDQLTYESIFES